MVGAIAIIRLLILWLTPLLLRDKKVRMAPQARIGPLRRRVLHEEPLELILLLAHHRFQLLPLLLVEHALVCWCLRVKYGFVHTYFVVEGPQSSVKVAMLTVLLGRVYRLSDVLRQRPIVTVLVVCFGIWVLRTRRRIIIILIFILFSFAHLRYYSF